MFIILSFETYILNPFALLFPTMNKLHENRIISSDPPKMNSAFSMVVTRFFLVNDCFLSHLRVYILE